MKNSFIDFILDNSKKIIVVFLLVSLVFGYGVTNISMESDLQQFQSDTPEVKAQEYIQENFSIGNETSVQIIFKDENVFEKDYLLDILDFQQKIKENELINSTLTENQSMISIANYLSINSISSQKINEISEKTSKIKEINKDIEKTNSLVLKSLNESRELQREIEVLNVSYENNEINQTTYQEKLSEYKESLDELREKVQQNLSKEQFRTYLEIQNEVIGIQHDVDVLNQRYQAGLLNESAYQRKLESLTTDLQQNYKKTEFLFEDQLEKIQVLKDEIEDIKSGLEETPSLDEQINHLEDLNQSEIDSNLTEIFTNHQSGSSGFSALALMPMSFNQDSLASNSTMMIVMQKGEGDTGYSSSETLQESQRKLRDIGEEELSSGKVMVLGQGIITEEIDQSMNDSLKIVLPLAFFFVVLVLVVAYRDLLDILLGVLGIFLVLIWTMGLMGLVDFSFNQMFVAIPALLTGLSIDFAIHVIMRHREELNEHPEEDIDESMKIALSGVGVALIWVTVTTIIGFMSNVSSPIPPIRKFGLISSFGIFSALLILGVFIPAFKTELDVYLTKKGFNRKKRAFGTSGVTKRFLSIGAYLSRKKPYLVIFIILLITAAGVYGSIEVDTSFKQKDFLAEEPPGWMNYLPEQLRPGEYSVKSNLDFLNKNYPREDQKAQILIEGEVDNANAVLAVDEAHELLKDSGTVVKLPNGEPRIDSVLNLINETSRNNESFNKTLNAADTDQDGVPDQNISMIYNELREIYPDQTKSLVFKDSGEYKALRLIISVKGDAEFIEIKEDISDIADSIGRPDMEVTATGDPIVFNVVETNIFETVINSLIIAMASVFLFIIIAFWYREDSAILGFFTLLPVLFIVFWIVGTMYALGISFNVMTALITNITIGLGIDYSIHISERFKDELIDKQKSVSEAINQTVTGTGGALLGTALTTIGGFGVLGLAILPPIKNFGLITAITIAYSFIAGVLILPSLLVIWAKMSRRKKLKEIRLSRVNIRNLNKSFSKKNALKDVELDLSKGIYLLAGPNEAGKTTLLKTVAGEIKKYSGEITISGRKLGQGKVQEKIGYLPEEFELYEEMTGYEYLRYMASLKGLDKYEASKEAYQWLKNMELEEIGKEKIKKYSLGMKRRLGLAQAFIGDPKIILLDEPTSDLDPLTRKKILKHIKELSNDDKTILMASQFLEKIEDVIDELIIIKDGEIIDEAVIEEISGLTSYYKDKIGGEE